MTGSVRRKPAKKDTLLSHCLARAFVADEGGEEAAAAKYGEQAERLSEVVSDAGCREDDAEGIQGRRLYRSVGHRHAVRRARCLFDHGVPALTGQRTNDRPTGVQRSFSELLAKRYETPNELARATRETPRH